MTVRPVLVAALVGLGLVGGCDSRPDTDPRPELEALYEFLYEEAEAQFGRDLRTGSSDADRLAQARLVAAANSLADEAAANRRPRYEIELAHLNIPDETPGWDSSLHFRVTVTADELTSLGVTVRPPTDPSETALPAGSILALAAAPRPELGAQAPPGPDSPEAVRVPAWVMLSGDPVIGGNLDWGQVSQACAMEEEETGEPAGECLTRRSGPRVRAFPLHTEPDPDSRKVGRLLVVRRPEQPLAALFLPADSLEARLFVPDLYDPDWGYGPPWFHQTLLKSRGEWYRLPRRPFPEPVWVPLGRDGRDVQVHRVAPEGIYTALGPLAERHGVASEDGGTVMVSVSRDAVFLRPEEPWDMPCGLDEPAPPPSPDPGVRVPFPELYDGDLHLLLRVRYTRGC